MAPLTADDIKDELWLEVARHYAFATPNQAAAPASPPSPPSVVDLPLPTLLTLDGAAFVNGAYQTVLGRAPDDAGAANLLQKMTSGMSKILLLGQLQTSPEGRRAGRLVRGLRARYLAHRAYAMPLVGGAIRLAGAALRRTGVSRALVSSDAVMSPRTAMGRRLDQLAAAHAAMEQRSAQQDAAIAALQAALSNRETTSGTRAAVDGHAQGSGTPSSQSRAFERRLADVEDSSIETMLAMSDTLAEHATAIARLESVLNGEAVAAQIADGATALRQSLDARLDRAEAVVAQNRHDVIDQQRRIGLMLEALRRRPEPMPAVLAAEDDHAFEPLYIDFEDRFRGARAEIKQRQRFYLPILAEAQAGSPQRPVLDIGCGRGEFLELLRDEGLVGRGADVSTAMADACRTLGLDCVAEDALEHLGRQPAGSLGAVTGMHIVEHLPFKTMVRLFDAALAALAPGGVLAFETPNPANLLVASRWFYLDPTHRNPLPGEMLAMIAEARGFCRVSVVPLHPMTQRFGGEDRVLREQLDALFHGPQDYALLARKP